MLTAYFKTLAEIGWPFKGRELRLSRSVQVWLATGEEAPSDRLRMLTGILCDNDLPGESGLAEFYVGLSGRLIGYLRGTAVWGRLDPAAQDAFERSLYESVPGQATGRYEELLRRLGAEIPEVAFWSNRLDHARIDEQLHRLGVGLAGLGEALEGIALGERRMIAGRRSPAATEED